MKNRWIILAFFSIASGLTQMFWLCLAPLITWIEKSYGVSEDTAGLLILVFPLVYVLLSVPSGRIIDKYGYRFSTLLGMGTMTAFSFLRVYKGSFAVLLIAQTGIAVAQPFIVNGISKLVLDWFDKRQEALATGLGTLGMFAGMALGLMLTPTLVDKWGYQATMTVFAGISFIALGTCYRFVRSPPLTVDAKAENKSSPLKTLFRDKNLNLIFAISFLGLGFFNGLTTWLEPILAPRGINSVQAGQIGGVLILGGVVGAIVIPLFSDLLKQRKILVALSILIASLTLYPLCQSNDYHRLLFFAALQGFFFLPAFSLILEMCAEQAGKARAGTATSILMLLGNLGGVVVIIAMEAVKTKKTGFAPSVDLLFGVLLVSFALSLLTKDTYKPSYAPDINDSRNISE